MAILATSSEIKYHVQPGRNMINIQYVRRVRFMLICILSLASCLTSQARYLNPNQKTFDTIVTVVDTVRANEIFQTIKPSILREIDSLQANKSICLNLLMSNKNKAETSSEKEILLYADAECSNFLFYGDAMRAYKKDLQKNKLTPKVKTCLTHYNDYLKDRILFLNISLENNWLSFLDNPPTKQITVQELNPNFRGLHYDDYWKLNKIEETRMTQGYEFLLTKEGEHKKQSYPIEISYLQYPELPNCIVIDNNSKEIYNKRGELLYVALLKRQSNTELYHNLVSEEIKRLVYLKDYQKNKYNIKFAGLKTQDYLTLWITRTQGFYRSRRELSELNDKYYSISDGPMGMCITAENKARRQEIRSKSQRYEDDRGERFLKQLESDHAEEFGYIYAIERISDKQFLVVYINKKTLQPSISAIVTFTTGAKPYTSDFSVRLCKTPDNIPLPPIAEDLECIFD